MKVKDKNGVLLQPYKELPAYPAIVEQEEQHKLIFGRMLKGVMKEITVKLGEIVK